MEKQRGIKALAVVALLIAVGGLTIAFAAMSKTLTINGTATMDTAKWDIRFEDLVVNESEGGAEMVVAPTLQQDDTYIGDFEIKLTKPGDKAGFSFVLANRGDIDAKIDGIKYNGILQSPDTIEELYNKVYENADWDADGTVTEEDIAKARDNINFGLEMSDSVLDLELSQQETANMTFYVEYKESATELPAVDENGESHVTLNFNMEMLFSQK